MSTIERTGGDPMSQISNRWKLGEDIQYNTWLEQASRDENRKVECLKEERTIKEVRFLMDIFFLATVACFLAGYFAFRYLGGVDNGWGVVGKVLGGIFFLGALACFVLEGRTSKVLKQEYRFDRAVQRAEQDVSETTGLTKEEEDVLRNQRIAQYNRKPSRFRETMHWLFHI